MPGHDVRPQSIDDQNIQLGGSMATSRYGESFPRHLPLTIFYFLDKRRLALCLIRNSDSTSKFLNQQEELV